jgi:two-component system chemotaxis response regulator CheB
MQGRIKVFIVDDSALVRQVLADALSGEPGIEVLGAAMDPLFAWDRMQRDWPDVIIMDIEMPRMDGLTFLRKIMAERPTPVIICSTLTEARARPTLEALSAGAVEVISKAKVGVKSALLEAGPSLVSSVRAAARANVRRAPQRTPASPPAITRPPAAAGITPPPSRLSADVILPKGIGRPVVPLTERLIAIGTSTGGTQALDVVLAAVPKGAPGILIVQHMPERFTAPFAARLNERCQIEVKEAADGDLVQPGRALIAPGGRHMMLRRVGGQYSVEVRDGPPVNRHRPSVDVLFRSVARTAGKNALGVIMTGMGDDGAAGMLEMRTAGSQTVAQSEETCVVFGMPREAIRRGAVDRVLPLQQIAGAIMGFAAGGAAQPS